MVSKVNRELFNQLTQIGSPRWLEAGAHVFNGPQHPGSGPLLIHVNPGEHLIGQRAIQYAMQRTYACFRCRTVRLTRRTSNTLTRNTSTTTRPEVALSKQISIIQEPTQINRKTGPYSLVTRSTMIDIIRQIRTRPTTTSRQHPRTRARITRTTMLHTRCQIRASTITTSRLNSRACLGQT